MTEVAEKRIKKGRLRLALLLNSVALLFYGVLDAHPEYEMAESQRSRIRNLMKQKESK